MFDQMYELDGFDLDIVGFDCLGEIEHGEPWACPFQPGCGAPRPADCPLRQRLAQISRAPRRRQ